MGSYSKIRPRRGTLYEWSTINPLLAEGELVVEYPDKGIGTGFCKFKIGDGTHRYNDLEYAFDGTSSSGINGGGVESFHTICVRGGTEEEWLRVDPILQKNEITYDSTNNSFKVGDGISKWSELEYIGGNGDDIIECGDEDAAESRDSILDNSNYPDSIFDKSEVANNTPTATINDILGDSTVEDSKDDQEDHNFTAEETEEEKQETEETSSVKEPIEEQSDTETSEQSNKASEEDVNDDKASS